MALAHTQWWQSQRQGTSMVVASLAVLSAVFRAMLSCTGAADSDPLSGISQVLHRLQAIMILLSRCAEGMPCCSWDAAVARRTLTFMRLSVRLSGEAAGGWFPDRWEGKRESCFRIYICGAFQAMPCPRPAMSYGICGMHLRTHSSNGLPMERLFFLTVCVFPWCRTQRFALRFGCRSHVAQTMGSVIVWTAPPPTA